MKTCYQFKTMSILDHGWSVWHFYSDLYDYMFNGEEIEYNWDLPEGFIEFMMKNKHKFLSEEKAKLYAIYHDCSKPFCRTIDEDGKQHFYNHAQLSYDIWVKHTNNEEVGWFILHDMDLHSGSNECISVLLSDDRIFTLLLMAYAEIHSNSGMFGSLDSTSFKIKRKRLDKIFKKLSK
jgi:hypothetical protein